MKTINRLSAVLVRTTTQRGFHHDGGGLYLQVSASGSKSWVMRYMLRGSARYMGLGSAADVSLAEARTLAAMHRKVAKSGHDPIDQRRRDMRDIGESAERFKTFEWCAREHHKEQEPEWRNAKHAAQWINTLRDYAFPRIGKLPVNEVTLHEVKSVLTPIWTAKPETSIRVMQRIRSVLTWAAANQRYPGYDASMWEQLRKALPSNKKRRAVEHLAACPYSEAADLLNRLRNSSISPMLKLAFEFTVLTAARSGEARGAMKSEIDLKACTWTVPGERMKMGKDHVVPLSRQAISVVKAAFALAPDDDLVFPNPNSKAFTDQAFTKVVLRETLKVEHTTHGFRSTFRTWAAEQTAYPTDICEAALAHAIKNKVEAAYKRTAYLEKRQPLMQDWANFLSGPAAPTRETTSAATSDA